MSDDRTGRARRRELKNAGVAAAREARSLVAVAVASLDEGASASVASRRLARELSFAVASLFGAEVGEPESVRDRLREASGVLSGVLSRMHSPEHGRSLDEVGATIARTLTILYPVRAGLERELERVDTGEVGEALRDSPEPLAPKMPFEEPLPLKKKSQPPPRTFPAPKSEPPVALRARKKALELVADAQDGLVERTSGSSQLDLSERRIGQRMELAVDIGMHSATQFFAGVAGDVSEGGLFVATYAPLPLGSEIVTSFVLPGGHHVTTPGIVAWLRDAGTPDAPQPGMGIRFFKLDPEDQRAIDRFLKVRPPMLHE